MKLIIEVTEDYYEFIKNCTLKSVSDIIILDGKPYEARPTGEWIPVKDLNNFIRTCREELFEKMKDYPPQEFEIRENMLLNFEQIVKLASSKYEADIRGNNNAET